MRARTIHHPRSITLDRRLSAASATAESANSVINLSAINRDDHEAFSSTAATTTAPEPTGTEPNAELVMGRKKILISQIADERNRQVKMHTSSLINFSRYRAPVPHVSKQISSKAPSTLASIVAVSGNCSRRTPETATEFGDYSRRKRRQFVESS